MQDASEGSRGARLDEAKIGERQAELPIPTQATGRRSRYTAVHDNPEFESSPTDTLASKDPTLEGQFLPSELHHLIRNHTGRHMALQLRALPSCLDI